MYRGSRVIVPIFKTCRRVGANCGGGHHQRNLWDLVRPFDTRNVFRDMERQMDQFERAFFRNNPLRIITPREMPIEGRHNPKDSSYRVNIDVTGFKPDDIKISLKDNVLKIEAQMDRKAEDGSRFQQSIVREFTLPPNVEPSTVKSLLHEDGILSIEASLNQKENQPKDIPIQHLESDNSKTKS